ncbi:hypothetical protein B0H19DRAFT_1070509 [Mycena capillaripes]|nr:hypothetical protein B0H19DRAFT_1070509 [Mycena capillaripes]
MADAPDVSEAATTTSPAPSIKKATSPPAHHQNGSEADAQEMVITSLRAQIQDLFSQVTQLNGKLVKSYDRVSDLEDDLHMASAQARQSSLKISQLELERTQHLSALNTGLLVEKSHVTAELTRLMEKATDEAAQRGQAESAKADIEKDLDDLSATLFAQANTMVAEARYAQANSERRVEQAETALKGAEEMVGMMQQQMQALQFEKDEAERKAREIAVVMGKGKWVDRRSTSGSILVKETRLLSSHLPYQEFLMFVAHLRSVHPSSPSPPAMTTLLPMAFLARLSSEDSEPTVRLDLAPSLNWLSRRSVLAAIHTGQLTIEPMSSSVLLSESSSTNSNIPGLNSSNNNISCALCGTPIFSTPETHHHARPPTHPSMVNGEDPGLHHPERLPHPSAALIITPAISGAARTFGALPSADLRLPHRGSAPAPAAHEPAHAVLQPLPFLPSVGSSRSAAPPPQPQSSTNALTNLSLNALTQSATASSSIYPLCTSGWCLARLRTTCTLWAFVRTGVVERVWEEEMPTLLPAPPPAGEAGTGPPPVPPRRRGLWGMASKLGERAASWSGDNREKEKKVEEKTLPTPPPMHPTISAPSRSTTPAPPLPKRSEGRNRVPAPAPPAQDEQPAPAPVDLPNPHSEPALPNPHPEPALPNPHPEPAPTPAAPAAVEALKAGEAKKKRFSAHQVPLPDSRPQTPIEASTPAVASATDAPPTPTTPAPSAGAPPPIPRRAAARRPVPPPPPPETHAPAAENPAPADPVVSEATVVPEESKAEKTVDAEVAVAKAEETKVDGDVPAAAETNAAVADTATAEKAPEPETKAEEVKVEGEAEVPRVDSPVPAELTKRDVEKEKDPFLDEESEEKGEDKKDEEDDHEAYVGDVTWEERTWKELVRLREDMYWARIGGVRSS